ncbi:MAG: SAM-dependent chlorinase/fluorinase [Bacteroidota bacterium]|nr:SAM-dependent chlorinase/fluorinase [Bacteroidota bacterium]
MPIVTLSTDIGLYDYIPGAIKGQLLSVDNTLNIVDITHALSPFDYTQTAYICNNAFKYFPPGTIHILIVNLFEISPKHFLIAKHNGQYIICPDNGILTMITGAMPDSINAVLVPSENGIGTLQFTNAIANVLKQIKEGKNLEEIGEVIKQIEEKYPPRSTIGADWLEGQIIFIDNFENVVVNITKEEFEEHRRGRHFHISFMRNEMINVLSENYASVSPGEKLAWFNAAGFLEISVNKGNMAGLFGLRRFTNDAGPLQNKWFYQTVRIYFV